MKVTTVAPMTITQMIELSPTKDALISLGEFRCRYMAASPGQEIEVDDIYCDPETGLAFGLRKVNRTYEYLAYRIH